MRKLHAPPRWAIWLEAVRDGDIATHDRLYMPELRQWAIDEGYLDPSSGKLTAAGSEVLADLTKAGSAERLIANYRHP